MRVEWTLHAIGNVASIRDYIAQRSPQYGQRMATRIVDRCRQLNRFPNSGQMVPEYQDAELREVLEGPYRIIYRVHSDCVRIVTVVHGARALPDEAPG
jgi:plasmid stabilization system protein ParE